jgi:hypothetical protein
MTLELQDTGSIPVCKAAGHVQASKHLLQAKCMLLLVWASSSICKQPASLPAWGLPCMLLTEATLSTPPPPFTHL